MAYMVQCQGRPKGKWVNYGGPYETKTKAIEVAERAIRRRTCSIHGCLIRYRITNIKS